MYKKSNGNYYTNIEYDYDYEGKTYFGVAEIEIIEKSYDGETTEPIYNINLNLPYSKIPVMLVELITMRVQAEASDELYQYLYN